MKRCLLVEPNRKIPMAVHLTREYEKMPRAVHRFYRHLFLIRGDEKHVLAIVRPVSRGFPKSLVIDEWRLHLDIPRRQEHVAHVIGERVIERRALRQPESDARRPWMKHEQAQFTAQLAVITLSGFFEPNKILV